MKITAYLLAPTLSLFSLGGMTAEIKISVHDDLQSVLDNSSTGDVILLSDGRYVGNFIITQGITLKGSKQTIIDANGAGNGLTLFASNITIEDLNITNWGDDLTEQNAGIYNDQSLTHLTIRNNQLQGDGFGIWTQKAEHIHIEGNSIIGNPELRSADRGNGIQLSAVKHAVVKGNTISLTRDGLYVISSQESVLENNTMHDLRYGIHYMYSHNNQVINNFAYNTRAGYALMSSKDLTVHNNRSLDSQDYGILMNFITSSDISYNQIKNVWTYPENKVIGREGKGLFVYNSNFNTISYNTVDTAEIGIHLTAGSENGKIFGNSFINNPIQVKYVSTREQEWSQGGIGNYWSNYLGWDLNNDNIGDTPFEPNDGIDKIVWKYPESKVLLDSPSVLMLRWIQKQFPILKPPGVKDSFPLMTPEQQGEPIISHDEMPHQKIEGQAS
ncbi:nitrous oxide reductase family maturation protein NosD [Vibrio sp. ZSDE26]|uniref:Nitrous oxide reductase family maturation protein NosD n=1 Tax=Vibrio amylolyticus TaxID=2847292 RepID=A0A9X1XM25_9VIBR|nr:nitrous oxide reductase family maturation protein NosD [Vibrio amylolyticus]MCK6265427.1 nitrous oxide reductase family maturation protein NosD [Vibrio amylolyticus]